MEPGVAPHVADGSQPKSLKDGLTPVIPVSDASVDIRRAKCVLCVSDGSTPGTRREAMANELDAQPEPKDVMSEPFLRHEIESSEQCVLVQPETEARASARHGRHVCADVCGTGGR